MALNPYEDAVEKCDEVMNFFRFSHDSGHSFRGTVCFQLSVETGETITRTVRIHDAHYVQLYNGEPSDGKIDCRVSMPFPVFTDVYWGKVHPIPLLMNGTIKLHGWTHGPVLKNFSKAFDFSSEKWVKFYAHRDSQTSSSGISKTNSSSPDEQIDPFADEDPFAFPADEESESATRIYDARRAAIVGDWSLPLELRLWSASVMHPSSLHSQSSQYSHIPDSLDDAPRHREGGVVVDSSGAGQYGMVFRRVIGPSLSAAHPHAFVRNWRKLFRPRVVSNALRLV